MIAGIQDRIHQAARKAGRAAASVTLIAVSKQQSDERIDAVLASGVRVFGENRVREAGQRWQHRRPTFPDLQLHLIGPLQSNKAKEAVSLFDVFHTIDRQKIALAVAAELQAQNKQAACFIQVNTGEEPQKSGIAPYELSDFLSFCRIEAKLSVCGLMCIPPADEEPALHFALLRTLADTHGLSQLSMGMSADFEEAIAFGATHVRIGSAVFGSRASAVS